MLVHSVLFYMLSDACWFTKCFSMVLHMQTRAKALSIDVRQHMLSRLRHWGAMHLWGYRLPNRHLRMQTCPDRKVSYKAPKTTDCPADI